MGRRRHARAIGDNLHDRNMVAEERFICPTLHFCRACLPALARTPTEWIGGGRARLPRLLLPRRGRAGGVPHTDQFHVGSTPTPAPHPAVAARMTSHSADIRNVCGVRQAGQGLHTHARITTHAGTDHPACHVALCVTSPWGGTITYLTTFHTL